MNDEVVKESFKFLNAALQADAAETAAKMQLDFGKTQLSYQERQAVRNANSSYDQAILSNLNSRKDFRLENLEKMNDLNQKSNKNTPLYWILGIVAFLLIVGVFVLMFRGGQNT